MNIYKILLRLDGPVLKRDNLAVKIIKRKILKPIGYHFRKMNYNRMTNMDKKTLKDIIFEEQKDFF